MAEPCNTAFGRYLRILRERRSLSLDEVASLSKTFADSVAKSYLSRVENGHISLALPKLIPLSRIYEVPSEVVLERLELDLELDRIGGPQTNGSTYAQLSSQGKAAIDAGEVWNAYAFFRDAVHVARSSDLLGRLRDHTEQLLCSFMNVGSAAIKLGRAHYAVFELKYIESTEGLSHRLMPMLFERIATAYLALDMVDKARKYGDAAIAETEKDQHGEYAGYYYSTRARIAMREMDLDPAIDFHKRAFEAFRASGREPECAQTLLNLSESYLSARRYRSARRALTSAERLASPSQQRTRALIRIVLGEIDEIENRPNEAAEHWQQAASIAKQVNDRITCFKADYLLYKLALTRGQSLAARAIEKRLRRASSWIPEGTEELRSFIELSSHRDSKSAKRVARSQLAQRP